MKSARTKATAISKEVKEKVYNRDSRRCILCGSPYANPEAHYIPRGSKGGLGIEENIVTVCRPCHMDLDGRKRAEYLPRVRKYLEIWYPDFTDEQRIYKKWSN